MWLQIKTVWIHAGIASGFLLLTPRTVLSSNNLSLPVGLDSSYLLKTVIALCVVMLVIWLSAKLLRPLAEKHNGSTGSLKILASISVGSREKLLIIQAGDAQFLIGVSPAGIQKIEKYEEPLLNGEVSTGKQFREQLGRFIGDKDK